MGGMLKLARVKAQGLPNVKALLPSNKKPDRSIADLKKVDYNFITSSSNAF